VGDDVAVATAARSSRDPFFLPAPFAISPGYARPTPR